MSKRFEIAIIGATSPIAEALLELLAERRFPAGETSALVLDPETDATVSFVGQPLLLEDARTFEFSQVQLAFLTDADPELAAQAERAADAGVVVIDASNQIWTDPAIPRVVPEVNPAALAQFNDRGIVGAPDRLNVALAPVLAALHGAFGLQAVSISGLLAASDFGRGALEDLARETTALLNARHYERGHFAQQIAFNVLPQDGDAGSDGHTERERRIATELQQLLKLPELAVNVSLLALPVFYGHSAVIELHCRQPVAIDAARKALGVPGIELNTELLAAEVPTPVRDAALPATIRIARLRAGADDHTLLLWLSVDNIRRCAAQNAVASAECLIRDYL